MKLQSIQLNELINKKLNNNNNDNDKYIKKFQFQ